MSHITSDNKDIPANGDRPLSSLVPPQEEKASIQDTGKTPLVEKGVALVREYASRLPLDLTSDADPLRDKALSDSVRAGVVDDVGVEENRRIFNTDKKVV